jgi:hypothetical protein
VAVGVSALLAGACTTVGTSSGDCLNPPKSATEFESEFEIVISPNPVVAETEAIYTIEHSGLPASVGVATSWECWDGVQWVETHLLIKGDNNSGPYTVEVSPSSTVTLPGVALPIPNSFTLRIPRVEPGSYRITEVAFDDETEVVAHEIVEVVSP